MSFVINILSEERKHYVAALAGLLTWIFLNKRGPVRGDYAALAYCVFGTACYASLVYLGVPSPLSRVLPFLATYSVSVIAVVTAYRLGPWHPLARYPGPWWWWISSLKLAYVSYMGRRHLVTDDLHKKYGPFVRIGPNTISINTLSAVRMYNFGGVKGHLEKSDLYYKPGHTKALSLFFKSPRDLHKERKAVWSAAFTGSAVNFFFLPLEKRTWELMACLERRQGPGKDGFVDLGTAFTHWAYDFMGEMVFGGVNNLELMVEEDPRGLVEGGKMATRILDSVGQCPWLMDLVWHLPFGRSMRFLEKAAAEMMRTRMKRSNETEILDLSSYLLEGGKVPQEDLELEAIIAIQGGSDSSGMTMALVVFFLLASPEYFRELRAELDANFMDKTGPLDSKLLRQLPWLNAVINEALRLGVSFFLPRLAPADGIDLDGHFLPGGTIVALASYSQHISPDNFYPDPLAYRPDRWLPGGLGKDSKCEKEALSNFSSGPYMCVAKIFAYQKLRYVLARLILAYDMHLPPNFDTEGFRKGILRMGTTALEKTLWVHVERRPGVNIGQFL